MIHTWHGDASPVYRGFFPTVFSGIVTTITISCVDNRRGRLLSFLKLNCVLVCAGEFKPTHEEVCFGLANLFNNCQYLQAST